MAQRAMESGGYERGSNKPELTKKKEQKMKKLMIAVAAIASVSAFADCERPTGPTTNCAEVYDVVLNVKTTECKCQIIRTRTSSSECGRTTYDSDAECVAWRQVVTKKIQGVIFNCKCSCTEDVQGSILDSTVLAPAVWNGDTSEAMEGNQYFWVAKDRVVFDRDADLLTIKWLGRIGKTLNQVEAAGTFQEGVTVAGYGAFDTRNGRVTSISGSAAGVWGAPVDCSDTPDYAEFCPAYKPCEDVVLDDYSKTFVSGTWSVKYNASKSRALASNAANLWGKVVPSAVRRYYRLSVAEEAKKSVYHSENAYKSTTL